jgi:hypothetical protein
LSFSDEIDEVSVPIETIVSLLAEYVFVSIHSLPSDTQSFVGPTINHFDTYNQRNVPYRWSQYDVNVQFSPTSPFDPS